MAMFRPFAEQVSNARAIMQTALSRGQMALMKPAPRPWKQPTLYQWSLPRISSTDVDRLADLPYVPPPRDIPREQLADPARDTRAQLYQDKTVFIDAPFVINWAYEVSRFEATPDQAGIVKFNWTYLELDDGSPTPVAVNPEDPFNNERYGIEVTYHLRLFHGTFQPIGPLFAGPALDIPTMAYPELPQWTDTRYMWGRTAAQVFYLVPANHAIRLFIQLRALPLVGVRLSRIGGRLQGYTQPIFETTTGENVRHGW